MIFNKKKILFFGDSITDAERNRVNCNTLFGLGNGFVRVIADRLIGENPDKYEIINKGINGNRVVDLYARIKSDVWNLQPDILSILVGVNDVWHEIDLNNGVELNRYENVYRMMIEETQKFLPKTKIVLCEPFFLAGQSTGDKDSERYKKFCQVFEYAKTVKMLAEDYHLPFVQLQDKFDRAAAQTNAEYYLSDGVHPNVAGASLIAGEWLAVYKDLE